MKKFILIVTLMAAMNFSFAQWLQKGNLLGLHVMTVKLNGNATMEEFKTFFLNQVIPAYEKQFQGARGYILKGVRGENNNSLAVAWLFNSEQSRNRYFNADGSLTDAGKAALEKLSIVDKELERIGTYDSKYTDWLVQ